MFFTTYFGIRRSKFGYCSSTATITPPILIHNPKNIYLYDNITLPSNSVISAVNAKFIMKENSGAAEGLMVRTGNHMIVLGKNHHDITDDYKKKSGKIDKYDKDVIVEEDVWIGCNVTLLSGVTIGRGATIGAGSIVVKSIPPYAIAVGVPARVVKFRWTVDQILQHEETLYPIEKRYTKEQIEQFVNL